MRVPCIRSVTRASIVERMVNGLPDLFISSASNAALTGVFAGRGHCRLEKQRSPTLGGDNRWELQEQGGHRVHLPVRR